MGLLTTAFFISSLFVNRADRIGHVALFIVFNFGIALILLKGYTYSWGAYVVFYGVCLYLAIPIFTGVDPNAALKVVSQNGISEIVIVPCICLYIIQASDGKAIDLKPAFFCLLISIWGVGRAGILSSAVLFIGLYCIKKDFTKLFLFGMCFIFFVLYLFFDQLLLLGLDNALFGNAIKHYLVRELEEGPDTRIDMWSNYLNNLNAFRIFFGANVLTDPWPDGEIHAYNYHNMFIHLHLQTGLMAIVFYIIIFCSFIKFWKSNRVFFVLLATICVKGMADTFLLFESWDFILYFFIFQFLRELHTSIFRNRRDSVSDEKFELLHRASD